MRAAEGTSDEPQTVIAEHDHYDALIVGAGATGSGLARDLAMRGVRCLVIDKGDFASGTTGRFHGLLHSGARYVVRDPVSAVDCIKENRILQRIARDSVESTGGYFCWLRGDPDDYPPAFLEGCQKAGIEVEEVPRDVAAREEPMLNPLTERVFSVPDASIQSFELVAANLRSAVEHGAHVAHYTRLAEVHVEDEMVRWVELEHLPDGERKRCYIGVLASAAGAWSGLVGRLAGIELKMEPGWGVMVIMNQRLSHRVLNRCRAPADGDIIVPVGSVCIAGTTDRTADTYDDYEIAREEVLEVMRASAELVPGLLDQRVLRVFAGARPLYDPGHAGQASRELSRAHTVVDHGSHGVKNMVSIVGGKLTTYRLMAEETADAVCAKLGVDTRSRTAEEELPRPAEHRPLWLGVRFQDNEVERGGRDDDVLCECEMVTRQMVDEFIGDTDAERLDDLLRGLRVGMGPCQATFCALRAGALLQERRPRPGLEALAPVRDFLEERLKGNRPILWGDQARQQRLTEIVYREVLDLEHAT